MFKGRIKVWNCHPLFMQALDRGAAKMKAVKMATGHNADDVAETILLNILRGDIARYSYAHCMQ